MLSDNDAANGEREQEFERRALGVSLAEKLRTMRMAGVQDGAPFAILVINPGLEHPVMLDLRLVEAQMVTSPSESLAGEREVDGIRLDAFGNPVACGVLENHPGGNTWHSADRYATVPAAHVIDAFRVESARPAPRDTGDHTRAWPLGTAQALHACGLCRR